MSKLFKHQPAHPLPWIRRESVSCGYGRYSAAVGPVILDPSEGEYEVACGEEDALYMGHAANAYPQLVEALQASRKLSPEWALSVNTLLRELGEDA